MPAQQKKKPLTIKQLLLCVFERFPSAWVIALNFGEGNFTPLYELWWPLVYCGIIVSARACKRLTAVRRAPRDPNGQRQSKKPFNSPPTDIKSSINFMSVISSGNVATFKLGNLSGLMQSSDRRAYNELFFLFRWQLRLLCTGSADHSCWCLAGRSPHVF